VRNISIGFATGVVESAGETGSLVKLLEDLNGFSGVLNQVSLGRVLTDPRLPEATRRGILADLLEDRIGGQAVRVLTFAVRYEPAGNLFGYLHWCQVRAARELDRLGARQPPLPEIPLGFVEARRRLEGYARGALGELAQLVPERAEPEIWAVEDELFHLARRIEGEDDLRAVLTDDELEAETRRAILAHLIVGRGRPDTVRLAGYVVRCTRARHLLAGLEWLVSRAAVERGRSMAEVRSAIRLHSVQRARLAGQLEELLGRPVEVRVLRDPTVVAGVKVLVDDQVIDMSLRDRIDQLSRLMSSRRAEIEEPGSADEARNAIPSGTGRD
jgi:F-type H+-transporting ATPase subunit delta